MKTAHKTTPPVVSIPAAIASVFLAAGGRPVETV